RLVSLQKGPGTEQLHAEARRLGVLDLGEALDADGAFLDTAAVIESLDLVVTVDTAVAHLAGALGAPVWLALATIVDWRWLLGREGSPWYPTLRLFRQEKLGDWRAVFERMAAELGAAVACKPRGRALQVEVSAGELLDKVSILQIKAERVTDP